MGKKRVREPKGIVGAAPGLRAPHGKGRDAAHVRSELLPIDEIVALAGPAGEKDQSAGDLRTSSGQFAPGSTYQQRKGGKARAKAITVQAETGLSATGEPGYAAYRAMGKRLQKALTQSICDGVGQGECGVSASFLIENAVRMAVAGRWMLDTAEGDPSKLAKAKSQLEGSRLAMLSAMQCAAVESQARKKYAPTMTPIQRLAAEGDDDDEGDDDK